MRNPISKIPRIINAGGINASKECPPFLQVTDHRSIHSQGSGIFRASKMLAYQEKAEHCQIPDLAATEGRPNRRTAGPCAAWDVPPTLWWWESR